MKTVSVRPYTRRQGSSLIEVLVVIVIFLVGILAITQIFPSGLAILKASRNNSISNQLARSEVERLKGLNVQLAEAILPVQYTWDPANNRYNISVDVNKRPNDIYPANSGIDKNGNLLSPDGTILDYWPRVTGANVARRVVGEGRTIPAPQFFETAAGKQFASLMTLQFGPVVDPSKFRATRNPKEPASQFLVYGNNLTRRIVDDFQSIRGPRDDSSYLVTEDGLQLAIMEPPYRTDPGRTDRYFRISASFVAKAADGKYVSKSVNRILEVPMKAGPGPRNYVVFDLSAELPDSGDPETFDHSEVDTIQVARLFVPKASAADFTPESAIRAAGEVIRPDAVYEYTVVDNQLGIMLFNPVGYGYKERRNRGATPLVARVDYDVLDWRIIREDFRVSPNVPYQQKLTMGSLKVLDQGEPDGTRNSGLGMPCRLTPTTTGPSDFYLVDRDSGAVVLPNSYKVDKSVGLITFNDVNNTAADGLQCNLVYPGETTSVVASMSNRGLRAMYMAKGEFAVQVVKASSSYSLARNATLGYSQCFVGQSDVGLSGNPTRIYFPLSDIGKTVIIGEIWYSDGSGNPQRLEDQEFLISAPRAGDPVQLASVELKDRDSKAVAFDYSHGYAVRRVRGSSVGVKVTWNSAGLTLLGTPAQNLEGLNTWQQNTRKTDTETFLVKAGTN